MLTYEAGAGAGLLKFEYVYNETSGAKVRMLTYADLCCHVLTYVYIETSGAKVRMLTYADLCFPMLT